MKLSVDEVPATSVMITEYTVDAYPDPDSINAGSFQITVAYRGKGLWAVCRHQRCYDRKGREDFEPRPSARTDKWLKRFRFESVAEAIELAMEIAPTIVVNGKTAAEVWAWQRQQYEAVAE